jgi:hypothetical protein
MTPTSPEVPLQPTLAWVGEPPPDDLRESLAAVARVVAASDENADVVAVSSAAGMQVVEGLSPAFSGCPVIATAPHDPTPAERMAWIKAGAEDLVSHSALPIAVARRLKRLRREQDSLHDLPAPSAIPRSTVPPGRRPASPRSPMPEGAASPPDPRLAPAGGGSDFPPLMVPRPDDGVPEVIAAWLRRLQLYLSERERLLGASGVQGLEAYLALTHMRDQVTPPSPSGEEAASEPRSSLTTVHGVPEQRLAWPALVRRGSQRGRQTVEVAEARIISAGTDGITIDVPFAASPRQKLVMDLAADDSTNAQFLVQARWQRRASADRWIIGGLILQMRMRDLVDTGRG